MLRGLAQYGHHLVVVHMWRRKLLLGATCLLLLCYCYYLHSRTSDTLKQHQISTQNLPAPTIKINTHSGPFIPPQRLVHLDLKGAPPKMDFLENLFPLLQTAGATGLLVEYEDMFPYHHSLWEIVARNSYSERDIKSLHYLAKRHNFEVIPLIQTFGHMEFVLKLQNYSYLREHFEHPQALCPQREGTFKLVTSMIDQVLQLHPRSKWIHIGSDEVYHIGMCPVCQKKKRSRLYLAHVAKVAKYIRDTYDVTPLIWDDMLRNIPQEEIVEFGLGGLVEPVVWNYKENITMDLPESLWRIYSRIFPNIWGASAFKGAFGETELAPDVKRHLMNNLAWVETMQQQHPNFDNFQGIILTGWQRYDHFATLCELLPTAIPSLIFNLLVVSRGNYSEEVLNDLMHLLQCNKPSYFKPHLQLDPKMWKLSMFCTFKGSSAIRMTYRYNETIKNIEDYIYDKTIHKAWFTEYNLRHNYSSPMRVDEALQDHSSYMYSINALIQAAKDALREAYDEYTVAEWIEQNLYPYYARLEKLVSDGDSLKQVKEWPRRPLPPLKELEKYSIGLGFVKE